MMSAMALMSSVSRHVARNVRHVSTRTHAMSTYQVFLVQTKDEFLDKVTNSDKPVLVNSTASWCDLCRNLLPPAEDRSWHLKRGD